MGWLEEQYKGTQTLGDDGKLSGRGLGAFLWQQFVDEEKVNKESQKNLNTKTAIAGGEDIDDLTGIDDTSSVYDVQGAVKRKGRERAAETKTGDREFALEPIKLELQAGREARTAELQAGREQRSAELQLAREKLAQTNNLTLLQMQQSSDQKIAELQYQKQRDRKTDMQYNERMESLDRKDRRTAMSNIAAGLASLGAAFAL